MTSGVRIGFAGCGRVVVNQHLPALRRARGFEVVAVADVDGARAEAVARGLRGARAYDDPADLVADERIELVAVCSPPETHAEVAHAALEAGGHVFVEKPLTLDLDEADALVEAATGRTAITGFNLRVHRQVLAARAALAAGTLGRLRMVRAHWTAGPRPPGWRADSARGGGALWEMGVHQLDLWRVLGGEPRELTARGDADALALSARTDDGVVLSATIVSGAGDANDVELVGDRASLTLTLYRGDGPHFAPATRPAGGPAARLGEALRGAASLPRQARAARAGGDYALSYVAEWQAVRAAVRDGAPPHASFADGRAAVAIAREAEAALGARV